ncbi:hypothetical protein DFH07DRAFT_953157 [Mycena maculata]|uniref:Uncharacterized protein n=1 Tax=Mycena maculata TaxID=230809 RepID=A0AAD7JVM6_9AGAR|nr:hypothetical protein DFH07DRAFT_953157 [Mycena maculata]
MWSVRWRAGASLFAHVNITLLRLFPLPPTTVLLTLRQHLKASSRCWARPLLGTPARAPAASELSHGPRALHAQPLAKAWATPARSPLLGAPPPPPPLLGTRARAPGAAGLSDSPRASHAQPLADAWATPARSPLLGAPPPPPPPLLGTPARAPAASELSHGPRALHAQPLAEAWATPARSPLLGAPPPPPAARHSRARPRRGWAQRQPARVARAAVGRHVRRSGPLAAAGRAPAPAASELSHGPRALHAQPLAEAWATPARSPLLGAPPPPLLLGTPTRAPGASGLSDGPRASHAQPFAEAWATPARSPLLGAPPPPPLLGTPARAPAAAPSRPPTRCSPARSCRTSAGPAGAAWGRDFRSYLFHSAQFLDLSLKILYYLQV